MKKLTTALVFTVLSLVACKEKTLQENKVAITADEQPAAMAAAITEEKDTEDDLNVRMDQLTHMQPVSTARLKAFFPGSMHGMTRTAYNVANSMGFAMGEATYTAGDETIRVVIYDCVGNAGAAFFSMNYLMRMNIEKESDDGYVHTINFKGDKALEQYDRHAGTYQLTYMGAKRFLVQVEGNGTALDTVKEAAESLDFSGLSE